VPNSTALQQRIQSYLTSGGLFNPESMNHTEVRQLILDFRDYLRTETEKHEAHIHKDCVRCLELDK